MKKEKDWIGKMQQDGSTFAGDKFGNFIKFLPEVCPQCGGKKSTKATRCKSCAAQKRLPDEQEAGEQNQSTQNK